MGAYLGNHGRVLLKRVSGNSKRLDGTRRFVAEAFGRASNRIEVDGFFGHIITGDYLSIKSTTGNNLTFFAGTELNAYAHVSEDAGIRLYNTFTEAISGDPGGAIAITATTVGEDVEYWTEDIASNQVAEIKDYELTTSRDNVDVTVLGVEHREHYDNGLITGQGRMSCVWEYQPNCSDGCGVVEFPQYLAHLAIRIKSGSDFRGAFILHLPPDPSEQVVWYESHCVITNHVLTVPAAGIVETRIEFVTSGPIELHQDLLTTVLADEGTGAGFIAEPTTAFIKAQVPE